MRGLQNSTYSGDNQYGQQRTSPQTRPSGGEKPRPQRRSAHRIPHRSEKVLKAVEAGDKAAAQAVYVQSVKIIDRIADKGVFHKNKAARHKSRLSAKIKAMA